MEKKNIRYFVSIIFVFVFMFSLYFLSPTVKVEAEDNFPYSDAVVENLAAAMTSEIGCGNRDEFFYELIWAGIFINNYNYYFESRQPSTVVFTQDNMCNMFKYIIPGSDYYVYTPQYCYFAFGKTVTVNGVTRTIDCTTEQKNQLKLAAKLVLGKSFNIPNNIYMAAEKSVIDDYGTEWVSFQPNGGWRVYYAYQNTEALSNKDVYGNTLASNDPTSFRQLAECLYNNPRYNLFNNCNGTPSTTQSTTQPVIEPTTEKTDEEHIVRFYLNDKTNNIYTTIRVENNKPVEKPIDPTREGYTFVKWITAAGTEYDFTKPVVVDLKLYASWSKVGNGDAEHTVTFYLNDGTDKVYDQVTVENDSPVEKPEDPTREGYIFVKWATEDGTEYDFTEPVVSDLELRARWKKESGGEVTQYTVTFYKNDGTDSVYHTIQVDENSKVKAPDNPTRDGYVFVKWQTKNGKDYNFSTKVTSDLSLYAKWNKEKTDNPDTGVGSLFMIIAIGLASVFGAIYYAKVYSQET